MYLYYTHVYASNYHKTAITDQVCTLPIENILPTSLGFTKNIIGVFELTKLQKLKCNIVKRNKNTYLYTDKKNNFDAQALVV